MICIKRIFQIFSNTLYTLFLYSWSAHIVFNMQLCLLMHLTFASKIHAFRIKNFANVISIKIKYCIHVNRICFATYLVICCKNECRKVLLIFEIS